MNDEELRAALMAVQCDLHINQILLGELIARSAQPQQLLRNFQQAIDAMTIHAPDGIDQEQVVELRARAAQVEVLVQRRLKAAIAARQ